MSGIILLLYIALVIVVAYGLELLLAQAKIEGFRQILRIAAIVIISIMIIHYAIANLGYM